MQTRGTSLEITNKNIDAMVAKFYNLVIMSRLINSGKSNLSKQQDKIIADIYNLAHEILRYANNNYKDFLFLRIYNEAVNGIIINEDVHKVMQYPEKYQKMVVAKRAFEIKNQKTYQKICERQKNTCIMTKSMSK